MISRKTNKKVIAALLVCLFVLIILVVPSVFFIKSLVTESYTFYMLVKQKLAVGLFKGCEHSICETIRDFGQNPEIRYQIQEITKKLTEWIVQKSSDILFSVPIILLNLFVMLFTMFYFLKDGESLLKKLNGYLKIHPGRYQKILGRLEEIVHGVVFGYLLVALIQGGLGALGFFIFGVPSPLFWGLVMAFLALIPYLGTGVVWVPASLIIFMDGLFKNSNWIMFKGIALFIYSFIFVSSLDNIIRPKLMGGRAKIHPAVILVGIIGGIFMFGPFGVLIGPLVLSLTVVFIGTYLS